MINDYFINWNFNNINLTTLYHTLYHTLYQYIRISRYYTNSKSRSPRCGLVVTCNPSLCVKEKKFLLQKLYDKFIINW